MLKHVIRLAVAAMTFAIGIALVTSVNAPYCPAVLYIPHPPPKFPAQTPSAKEPDTSYIAGTIHRLQQFRTEDEKIPPAARPLLTHLKHQLRDFIATDLNAWENQGKSAELIQASIRSDLRAYGVTVEDPESEDTPGSSLNNSYTYGRVYDISIQQPHSHPELLVAITTIGVRCGSDSSIYIFKKVGPYWGYMLAQESNDYKDVSGAQEIFNYAISPSDADNNFFIVIASVNPWCASNWQTVRYAALRVGTGAYQPRIMASGKAGIYLGVDQPYQLAVGRDWFSISFEGEASRTEIMNGEISSKHVIKYAINGEKAKKISE